MPHSHRLAIADLVSKLLSHFATADEPLSVRRGIAEDWIDDLVEFTVPQVEWAVKEWRRNHSLRPTIAEIRKLATQAQQNEAQRNAIEHHRTLDAETLRMWDKPEYHGDFRSPEQRRAAAIEAQEEKYRRGAAYRAGKLDEYDAIHWPEKLAERQRAAAREAMTKPYSAPDRSIGDVLREMGISAKAAE